MEQYPKVNTLDASKETLLIIKSVSYNVEFLFLPYNLKITENLIPEWNEQSVIGRMDPIATFKRMGRTMTISFQARAKDDQLNHKAPPFLSQEELMHTVDHLKKTLYPRYEGEVMVTPPLFRFKYGNLISAGPNTFSKGVLGYITTFSANPNMEINKISVRPDSANVPFYPKIFDINLTFTVLNEELTKYSQDAVLDKQYFYNYPMDSHHQKNAPTDSSKPKTTKEAKPDDVQKAADKTILLGDSYNLNVSKLGRLFGL